MTKSQERILKLTELVRNTNGWTTYGTIGDVVYGRGNGAQTVGNTMRDYGRVESAHRILQSGGTVSPHWRGVGGGPAEAERRLKAECLWDETKNRARQGRFINVDELRRLEAHPDVVVACLKV
jgi:alkylated DNA nucleotide flippase Atl1